MEKKLTLGESRVRVSFNPSSDNIVDIIKQKSAEMIDFIDGFAGKPEWTDEQYNEFKRLKSLAMTSIEESAMWAVKSVTM